MVFLECEGEGHDHEPDWWGRTEFNTLLVFNSTIQLGDLLGDKSSELICDDARLGG